MGGKYGRPQFVAKEKNKSLLGNLLRRLFFYVIYQFDVKYIFMDNS